MRYLKIEMKIIRIRVFARKNNRGRTDYFVVQDRCREKKIKEEQIGKLELGK